MRPVLTIVDDFLTYPDIVRDQVLSEGFRTVEFEGTLYEDINPRPCEEIENGLEELFQRKVQLNVSAFRLGKAGSPLHSLVHADVTCASFAAVLYLNPDPMPGSGTAFWEHMETGWDQQPTVDQLQAKGLTLEEFRADWNRANAWRKKSLAGAKYNRLITYPTVKFHSRWPWTGFGHDRNARLIHASFFDLV